MLDLLIADLMTTGVNTCDPDTVLKKVVTDFIKQRFSCSVVIENNKPVGMITERDMVSLLADMLDDICWDAVAIKSFMSTPVITLNDDLKLTEAVSKLREKNIRHAPVVDIQGDLVGILTQADIVDGLFKAFQQQASA